MVLHNSSTTLSAKSIKKYQIQTCAKWHTHKPPEVISLKNVEIIWNTPIATDRPHVFNRPDIVVSDKQNKKCFIIDISCPNDINVTKKEQEKITKYSGLRQELGRMWDFEHMVVPIVISGLGVVSMEFEKYKNMLPADVSAIMRVKIALLGSEKLLRSFLARR